MILLLMCLLVMAIVSLVSMNIHRTSFLFGNSVSVTVIFVILLTMLIASIIKILFCIFAIDTFPRIILLCVLCPCTIGRYVMHLLYTTPLIIGAIFYKMEN